ncbi:hypothetical protein AG1IA_01552 [Rhizoctonia solani AG-1 IA]|uniref:Uncharacterized protein n=1 Tax=Thanatephorus cucumeris (strain AG1-IA) TaxID=983506 RepID=L8X707_THACA|nr:hypothetical protein AG1IA_01552 [Rhizoctonia solani AG-1 IA]
MLVGPGTADFSRSLGGESVSHSLGLVVRAGEPPSASVEGRKYSLNSVAFWEWILDMDVCEVISAYQTQENSQYSVKKQCQMGGGGSTN